MSDSVLRTVEETFTERVERLRPERETQPADCSHCQFETPDLTNHSRDYGGNVGAHWLCELCACTQSASRLGAGGRAESIVQDVAAMLNRALQAISG